MEKSRLLELLKHPLDYIVCDVKWIPRSAKVLVMGSKSGSGILQMFKLSRGKLKLIKDMQRPYPIKCGTFAASNLNKSQLAMGDFVGQLQVLDLERPEIPIFDVNAHKSMINSIDAVGGSQMEWGAPEIVTGSRDGTIKIWDIRQGNAPVVDITPEECETQDCWAVSFGNSYDNINRCVAAGFDNGDLKLIDLRMLGVRWETTQRHGICSIEFDRKDIPMKKIAVTTMQDGLIVYNMQKYHKEKGYKCVTAKNVGRSMGENGSFTGPKSTVWVAKFLPQNRNVFATGSGSGAISMWNYEYQRKRYKKHSKIKKIDIENLHPLHAINVSSQPINCFDWNKDREGLAIAGSLREGVRLIHLCNLNLQN